MTVPSKTSIRITTIADTLHERSEIVGVVNQTLMSYYDRQILRADDLHPRYKTLLEAMQQLAFAGGKRIRPYIAVTAYEAYGGNSFGDICKVGAALELLHISLLIHDDIIDRDLVRHGQENIAGQYRKIFKHSKDAAHYADSMAILAGDINITAAFQLVGESGFSAGQKQAVNYLISDAVFHVAGGELLDTTAPLYSTSETDPLDVAAVKTAQYSFVTPLLCGSVLAGANEDELALLTDMGMNMGIAFQLSDDLLGIFGNEVETGKSSTGDIKEGKQTWLYQEAYKRAKQSQRVTLQQYYGYAKISDADAETVRNIFVNSGAKKACQRLINSYQKKAKASLAKLAINSESRKNWEELINSIGKRKS